MNSIIKKYNTNEQDIPYEKQIYMMKCDDNVKNKAMIKLKEILTEKKELGGAYINQIERLTDRNNHTRARAELARHIGDKRLIKAYEGLMYVEDLLRDANETSG